VFFTCGKCNVDINTDGLQIGHWYQCPNCGVDFVLPPPAPTLYPKIDAAYTQVDDTSYFGTAMDVSPALEESPPSLQRLPQGVATNSRKKELSKGKVFGRRITGVFSSILFCIAFFYFPLMKSCTGRQLVELGLNSPELKEKRLSIFLILVLVLVIVAGCCYAFNKIHQGQFAGVGATVGLLVAYLGAGVHIKDLEIGGYLSFFCTVLLAITGSLPAFFEEPRTEHKHQLQASQTQSSSSSSLESNHWPFFIAFFVLIIVFVSGFVINNHFRQQILRSNVKSNNSLLSQGRAGSSFKSNEAKRKKWIRRIHQAMQKKALIPHKIQGEWHSFSGRYLKLWGTIENNTDNEVFESANWSSRIAIRLRSGMILWRKGGGQISRGGSSRLSQAMAKFSNALGNILSRPIGPRKVGRFRINGALWGEALRVSRAELLLPIKSIQLTIWVSILTPTKRVFTEHLFQGSLPHPKARKKFTLYHRKKKGER